MNYHKHPKNPNQTLYLPIKRYNLKLKSERVLLPYKYEINAITYNKFTFINHNSTCSSTKMEFIKPG